MKHHPHQRPAAQRVLRPSLLASLIAVACSPLPLQAATDISDSPLINSQVQAKPNIMFVLDNSGSMKSDYMPDDAGDSGTYGYQSSQCNGAAYNPNTNYAAPLTPDGNAYPSMAITGALADGFQPTYSSSNAITNDMTMDLSGGARTITATITSSKGDTDFAKNDVVVVQDNNDATHWMMGTVTAVTTTSSGSWWYTTTSQALTISLTFSTAHNGASSKSWTIGKRSLTNLTSSKNIYYRYTGTQTALAWKYSGGVPDTSSTFVTECQAANSNDSGNSVFSKVTVSTSSTEAVNYANWYSYYRTRLLLMRTAAGRAIQALNSDYRVGFNALNNNNDSKTNSGSNGSVSPAQGVFVNVGDFDTAQRVTFFSSLYGADAGSSTPLRAQLAKIGRYYGNAISGQTDPILYACQRNYTLLSTDGYWNDTNSNPKQLDNSTDIGNQDSSESTPMYDGTGHGTTVEERHLYTKGAACTTSRGSAGFLYLDTTQHRTAVTTPADTTTGDWVTYGTPANTTCKTSAPTSPSTTTTFSSATYGASNALADVAEYYYKTDLRTTNCSRTVDGKTIELCSNAVPEYKLDIAHHQHMTTYTMGLGLSGNLTYYDNYLDKDKDTGNLVAGAYADIAAGLKQWPAPPNDATDDPAKIDDLWHAAVNGRGQYFSATNPDTLRASLKAMFTAIQAAVGAGAASASSALRPVVGTDQVFIGKYTTKSWVGDIEARGITRDVNGNIIISTANKVWSAQDLIKGRAYTDRSVYYLRKASTNGSTETSLTKLSYANLGTDDDSATLTSYFDNFCSKSPTPSQCASLSATQKTAASGANLVNFLLGDTSKEEDQPDNPLFRNRDSVLGDIVDSSPVYVGKPPFNYTDTGYATFVTNNATRCPVVFAAANDGMLHAFSAKHSGSPATCISGGTELWAYVPRAVMPKLFLLADTNYALNHKFFVDGPLTVGDIYIPPVDSTSTTDTGTWKSILVGGLGNGGRSYYALDITSPGAPKPLWEFSDGDLGKTYGNAIITKVPDSAGTLVWAVVFASGYNNSNSSNTTNEGNGFLYILNANTGAQMYKIPTNDGSGTGVGSASTPSGLAKLNAWVDSDTNNTAKRFYGGDLLGNLWRFDTSNLAAPGVGKSDKRSTRLAQFAVSGTAQPITTRPELAEITYGAAKYPVVYVGTGQYLGQTDITQTPITQSIYAIRDPLTTTGWGSVRGDSGLIAQTLTTNTAGTLKTVSHNEVDWSASSTIGWKVDLPETGERMVTDMSLQFNTLSLTSAVPKSDVCLGAGTSWLYRLDIASGSYIPDNAESGKGGEKLGDYLALGLNAVAVQGQTKSGLVITNSDGTITYKDNGSPPAGTSLRRTSWRELLQ